MISFFRRIWNIIYRLLLFIPYKLLFQKFSISDIVVKPICLTPNCIELGEGVYIGPYSRLEGVSKYNNQTYKPRIVFGDRCSVQQGLYLTCANSITIGKYTAIAANVTITDIHHPYDDITIPIESNDIIVKEVVIGDECKIYNSVVILPGVHIGKHVTIGANSVVSKDIPDFCIAVGSPAKVVKRYDFEKQEWVRVTNE